MKVRNAEFLALSPAASILTTRLLRFFFLLALQSPSGVVFYSPLAGFSLLAFIYIYIYYAGYTGIY